MKNLHFIIPKETDLQRISKDVYINDIFGFCVHYVYSQTEPFAYHDHDFHELFLTISGTIIQYVNGQTQYLEPGCLVFVRPDDKHLYIRQPNETYTFVNIRLDPNIIEKLFAFIGSAIDTEYLTQSLLPPTVRLTSTEMKSILKKIDDFNAMPQEDVQYIRLKLCSFLLDVFSKHFSNKMQETENEIPLWLENAYKQMKKSENFTQGIPRMVEISGKTQEHLARSMQKYYHTTLSQFINDLKINYAINLVKNTNLKITDICYNAGFNNPSYFYNLFRSKYGKSPQKVRSEQFGI